MYFLVPFLFLATIVATSHANSNQIHLLGPHSGAGGHPFTSVNCRSWRLAVETNNIRDWDLVPGECENYIAHYMLGSQYSEDFNFVAAAAYKYAKGIELKGDGKDIWVFDIDDTLISTLPYHSLPEVAFGTKPFNDTAYKEWESKGNAPALPATLYLYNKLLKLGYKIVLITARSESLKNVTVTNMKNVGYHNWEKFIVKQASDKGTTALVYKSKKRGELVKQGYRIIGNMGDQWSDLLGHHPGNRTFKLPDPIFYAA